MNKSDFQPAISVIIPAYNRSKTISYCLDSVLAQTLPPFEVIVVDDCSSDDTVAIVKKYARQRVRCIVLPENSGAQVARNKGIFEAKGDWIAFQDSDDEWIPHKLERQVEALAKISYNPWTVVHTDAIKLDSSTQQRIPAQRPAVQGANVYPLLLAGQGPMFQGMLVSKLALEKIGFLDVNLPSFQEWDTSIRLAKHCRFIFLNEALFIYHLHEGETISKNYTKDIIGYEYIVRKFEQEIKEICGQGAWNNHLLNLLKKCLNYRLWEKADSYFVQISSKGIKYKVFLMCRFFHLPPYYLGNLKQYLMLRKT